MNSVKNRMRHGDGMSFAEFTYPLLQAWDWWELYQRGTQIQIGGADQFGNILAGAEAVKHLAKHDPEYEQRKKIGVRSHPNQVNSAVGTEASSQNASAQETESRNFKNDPMGFTVPLLTTSAGEKFGKSAGNAIWLDEQMTSTFDLYQVCRFCMICQVPTDPI
jgi:tyrosyl-tRNA synthetase